jgi:hypothetical protein
MPPAAKKIKTSPAAASTPVVRTVKTVKSPVATGAPASAASPAVAKPQAAQAGAKQVGTVQQVGILLTTHHLHFVYRMAPHMSVLGTIADVLLQL